MAELPDRPPIAAVQAGVFTGAQALEAGWTPRQVRRRLAAGRWRRIAGQGLVVADGAPTLLERAWAIHLTWPEAVVSHTSAGRLRGFPISDVATLHVIGDRRRPPQPGAVLHRVPLPRGQIARVRGLPVTTPLRTAVDCLALLPIDQAFDLWAWLSTRNLLRHDALWVAVRAGYGRAGNARLRRLATVTAEGAVNPAERRLHRLVTGAGLTGWRAGATVLGADGRPYVVDLLFEDARVAVELDGYRAHGSRSAFERDRRRQNTLQLAGYFVLRFTWRDLTERPGHVVAEIRRALAR